MKRYTVVCPGSGRYEEEARKKMRGDKRLHHGHGWEVNSYPVVCPECGDEAQPRGAYEVMPISTGSVDG